MIYIRTIAFNAEKTLSRAVDSILNQTYGDFLYYLCDNGSIDKTGEIIRQYAKKDCRIKPSYNKKNHVWNENQEHRNLDHNIADNDYFCILDADDEYLPTFLEDMLSFMDDKELDIGCCGNDFINASNNQLSGRRVFNTNVVLSGSDFSEYFPEYFQFARARWAKLYKGKTIRNITIDYTAVPGYPMYGGDTVNVLQSFLSAKRVGILAKSLYKYYIFPKSVSYKLDSYRINDDRLLYERMADYLRSFNGLTSRNIEFLYVVYFNAIKDTLNVVFNAQIPSLEKLRLIDEIFTCKYTAELLRLNPEGIRNDLNNWLNTLRQFITLQKEYRKPDNAKITSKILFSMCQDLSQLFSQDDLVYMLIKLPDIIEYIVQRDHSRILERIRTWFKRHEQDDIPLTKLEILSYQALNKSDDEIFGLLTDIRANRPQASKSLDIEAQIYSLIKKYPLLRDINADLACEFSPVIRRVFKCDYAKALDLFVSMQDVEINDDNMESYILFGQNLSAAAENTGAYIYFKKVWISYLLDFSRIGEASKELEEFEQLLPNDEDFIQLRKRLG